MFPLPEKPSSKHCNKCGSEVHPEWTLTLSPITEIYGWIGKSVCPVCSNSMTHLSGSPDFTIPISQFLRESDGI